MKKPPALTVHQIALAVQNAERRVARLHEEEYTRFFEEEKARITLAIHIDQATAWGRAAHRKADA